MEIPHGDHVERAAATTAREAAHAKSTTVMTTPLIDLENSCG
jgi:hypothetical protein